ncbi:winged helix-turn-helix transcriptional regulator [Gordonia sp. VNK21]|uniref:winged helix-turn-helix transcriptional regulator n=1 Tax=Gordonia sp. VNK21 TaxID=3382483 RepID=UPI0038D486B8
MGDRWTLLVLRELFYGQTRFEQFVGVLSIPRTTLADRLDKLVGAGIVTREVYQREPTRHEYVLTEKGRDFFPVMAAINAWGDKWAVDDAGVPVVLTHTTCGAQMEPVVVCSECHEPVSADDLKASIGPGYPEHLRERRAVAARFSEADVDGR